VHYMIEMGKISPNLGFGNARINTYQVWDKPLLAEVAMYVGDRAIRKAQLLRSPLFELWYKMVEGDVTLTFREMDESQRPDTLTYHAVWDEEEGEPEENAGEVEEGMMSDPIGGEGGAETAGLKMVVMTPDVARFVPVPSSPAKRSLEGQGEGTSGQDMKKQALGEEQELGGEQ